MVFGAVPNIKGPGLAALNALPNLGSLHLRHAGVTDDGLKHLKELKRREFVSLPKHAGAKSVEHLKGLKQLKQIAYSKGFDPKAVAELKAALPEAEIFESFD